MKPKIILLMHFSPNLSLYSKKGNSDLIFLPNGKFTGFNDVRQFWFFALGEQLMINYSDQIDCEVWQPDINADRVYCKEYPNGLKYKLFPAENKRVLTIVGFKNRLFSSKIVDSVKVEYLKNSKIVIHLRATNEYLNNYVVKQFHNKISFLGQSSVPISQKFKVKIKADKPLKGFVDIISLIKYKKYLIRINNLVPGTQNDFKQVAFLNKLNIYYRSNIANFGLDYNLWTKSKSKKEIKSRLGFSDNEVIILSSTRLIPFSQIDVILQVLSESFSDRKFKYVITSSSNDLEYIKNIHSFANKELKDKVIFTGWVDERTLIEYYNIADLFIAYTVADAGPFSVYQAFLMGIPVIQASVGIAHEVAKEMNVSRIAHPARPEQLRDAINDFFNNNPPKTMDVFTARECFGWDNIVKYYFDIYKELILK